MRNRFDLKLLLLIGCVLPIAGCSNQLVDTLSISPTSQSLAVGQTVQFTATGTVGHGSSHPATTQDVTDTATWTSSAPAVAKVSATGEATALAAGTTTITASINGYTGAITASATLTVTGSGVGTGSAGSSDITAVTIIPSTQSVASPGGTALFIPIGSTSSGASVNLTNLVTWSSSSSEIAKVNSAGMATAVSQGSATISALYTNPDESVATGSATFQVLAGNPGTVTALTIFPGSAAATSLGQSSQFTVLGTEGSVQYDLTGKVAWTSSTPSVANFGISPCTAPGCLTATAAGSTTIEATFTNTGGSQVVATATYSVTAGTSPEPLLSINVVPAGTTVSNQGMTGQYLAFGTFSTPPLTRDITNEVTWISLLPEVASVGNGGTPGEEAGLATAEGYTGNTVIYAEDTKSNPDGTVVLSNSQTFTCKDPTTNVCDPGPATPQFATITVFVEGETTFVPNLSQIGPDSLPYGEYITAPSDTGTPNLIHCDASASSPKGSSGATSQWAEVGGTGGVVCTGTYETGSTVVLTENLPAGSSYFGGWSSGDGEGTGDTSYVNACAEAGNPPNANILATSTTCTLTLTGNATVGVIFY